MSDNTQIRFAQDPNRKPGGYTTSSWTPNTEGATAKGCTSDLCNSFPLPDELLSQFPIYKLRRERYNQASASVRAASASAKKAMADADAAQKAADTALSSAADPDVSPAVAALIQVKLIHSFGIRFFVGSGWRFGEEHCLCQMFWKGLIILGTLFWNELGPFRDA